MAILRSAQDEKISPLTGPPVGRYFPNLTHGQVTGLENRPVSGSPRLAEMKAEAIR